MAYALLNHVQTTGSTSGGTSSAIDTSGADLLVINGVCNNGTGPTISDNKGNTYILAVNSQSNFIWYCRGGVVGAGHTFTIAGASTFSIAQVTAWSGSLALSVLGPTNQAFNGGAGATFQGGSVTPAATGSLVIAGLQSQPTGLVTIDSGFTITDQTTIVGGSHFGGGQAYLIQSPAAAVNPTWSGLAGGAGAANAVFKPAASAPGSTSSFFFAG